MPPLYTAVTRINTAFPGISSISAITSGVLCQYIDDVEAEINAIISKRYALPLTVTCPILIAIATRETIYRTLVQRAIVQFPPAQQGRHPLQIQHTDDQKLLEKIADGEIQLVDSSAEVISGDTSQIQLYSTTMNYTPTFSEDSMLDSVIDPDKLDDIAADRA